MRNNGPVSQQEYVLRDGRAIISKTDHKGRITHVNSDFVEARGFDEAELIGQAHNLLRHPGMCEASPANANRTASSAGRLKQLADRLEADAARFSV